MKLEKKIKLNNNSYYVLVDLKYKAVNKMPLLFLKNYKDEYFDSGNFSLLINKIEDNYNESIAKMYDKQISFIADFIYLYIKIPFLSGIKDVYLSKKDNMLYSSCYILREEIEAYIQDNNIDVEINKNFNLSREETW